jgi:predicted outer membrane repeat protein
VGGGLATNTGLTLEGVVVSNNQAANGAGVYVSGRGGGYGGRVAADDATEIFGNETYAGGYGGGVYFSGNDDHPQWKGGHIHDNTAAFGGGVAEYVWWGHGLAWAVVENNHATAEGGGVWITGLPDEGLQHVTVRGNTTDGSGGGIYFADPGVYAVWGIPLHQCIVAGNVAAVRGGGVVSEYNLDSVHSSWGVGPSGDNSPDDLALVNPTTGDIATFDGLGRADGFSCDVFAGSCGDR